MHFTALVSPWHARPRIPFPKLLLTICTLLKYLGRHWSHLALAPHITAHIIYCDDAYEKRYDTVESD